MVFTMHKSEKKRIFGISLTFNQWIYVLLIVSGTLWLMFNLSCSINTKFFSASTVPAALKTDHVQINTKFFSASTTPAALKTDHVQINSNAK